MNVFHSCNEKKTKKPFLRAQYTPLLRYCNTRNSYCQSILQVIYGLTNAFIKLCKRRFGRGPVDKMLFA